METFVRETLPSLNIRLKHFHSDGGAELIAKDILSFLHSSGVTTSHSPRDTPQMNSVTERWVRSLKEKVMCMLLRSSLPVAFWWFAVECAAYLLNRIPTKTSQGYMPPYECIFDSAPNLKWLRIWGANVMPSSLRMRGARTSTTKHILVSLLATHKETLAI